MREGQPNIVAGQAEMYLGAPPLFLLLGGVSMLTATAWLKLVIAETAP